MGVRRLASATLSVLDTYDAWARLEAVWVCITSLFNCLFQCLSNQTTPHHTTRPSTTFPGHMQPSTETRAQQATAETAVGGGGGVLFSPSEFGFVLLTLCMGTTNTVSVLRLLLTLHRIYLSYCIPESRRESKTKNSQTKLFLFSGGGRWLYVLKLSLKYRYIHVFQK